MTSRWLLLHSDIARLTCAPFRPERFSLAKGQACGLSKVRPVDEGLRPEDLNASNDERGRWNGATFQSCLSNSYSAPS